ncbi:phosphomethylpyrimidine synthase ThiC [Dehalococcoidales bacterium]|nr:phosphomethylpyrimidine synthase ThiC [Dehalococcoidales bacterium]
MNKSKRKGIVGIGLAAFMVCALLVSAGGFVAYGLPVGGKADIGEVLNYSEGGEETRVASGIPHDEPLAESGIALLVDEGPGHLPLNQIETNVRLQKAICKGAPFYVLGPLVTDIGAGYDHITGAIGGAIAAAAGTDFLCYVTPSEHLSLPDPEDVRQGVIASRIAAHAGDIVKGVKGANEWDLKMSIARKRLDWEEQARLSLDPERSRQFHSKHVSSGSACSMCGQYCAMALVEKFLGISASRC